jgi:peptidyl-prolyl cis-trans isomerase SurA
MRLLIIISFFFLSGVIWLYAESNPPPPAVKPVIMPVSPTNKQTSGRSIPVDGYAARVNDKIITVSEVLKAMQPVEKQLRETCFDDSLSEKLERAYENTLDSLIERELILSYFEGQKQFVLPDSVVDSRIDEIVRNKFNNNRAELRKVLDEEGMTFEEWRKNYKNSLIVALLREKEVDSKVVVSPLAIREAYEKADGKYSVPEQLEIRAIVINRRGSPKEAELKLKQAENIRQRVLAGESFEKLAREASEDKKAAEGGYWGWIDPDTRRLEIAEVLKKMSAGDISPVIPVNDDLYIFKVEGRKNSAIVPFETVQESIRNELYKKELWRLYNEWIERLKKNAYIKKF